MGRKEKSIPCGIVEEDRGHLHITFGSSSKTRDFIVEALEAWWAAWEEGEQVARARLQINMDKGPESRGKRTQFLQRMVAFCDAIGKPMQRLYSRLPEPVSSHRAVLGYPGIALERDHGGGRGDHVGMGQKYYVEGPSPDCRAASEGLPKRGYTAQAGDAGGGKPIGAPP